MAFEKLKELDLTREEVERIGEALKKSEFRQLLKDYVEEVQNPENRKLYEQEITELEKERGIDVTFINPKPGYVIKTSVDGSKKCFLNVCTNEHINKPSSSPDCKDGTRGLQWSLPHSLTPPREDVDNKGTRCVVYDVVFHPDTLHLALKNKHFHHMLTETACDAVEANFDVILDRKNLKFPKLTYKGVAHSAVVRKPCKDFVPRDLEPSERDFLDKIYAQADLQRRVSPKPKTKKAEDTNRSKYTTPTYIIKHRHQVELQDCVEDKRARVHAAIPKDLVVEVSLPLLRSSADITLDVTEKTVQLVSEQPSKYKLNLTLPYRVSQDNGNAKFDKDLKKLLITLPVKRTAMDYGHDSGVESDPPATPESGDDEEELSTKKSYNCDMYRTFLDYDCHYQVPEFTCHLFDNILAFTLNVKNVDQGSLRTIKDLDHVHIKFASISSSYYTSHYAFYMKLPSNNRIVENGVQTEVWDNNVILQVPLDGEELTYYFYGLHGHDLKQKFLEEPSVLDKVLQNTILEEKETTTVPSSDEKLADLSDKKELASASEKTTAISISGTSYESSGDELSYSYSPSKSKGILKRLSNRHLVGRSISESSLDDIVCSSVDSVMPEDRIDEYGEISTSLKKTVRFNDVIMRQLYRSNSSILGQKKKNQRKARNKKRAQERRHSESEASEIEDKKEDEESKTNDQEDYIGGSDKRDTNGIFDMDMNF